MNLVVEDLTVRYGDVLAVDALSFTVGAGEAVALVGESGSGKSTVALALLGLLPRTASVAGSVRLDGTELVGAGEAVLQPRRGRDVAVVFQESGTAFNPVQRLGPQLAEAVRCHQPTLDDAAVDRRVVELFELVGIADAATWAARYPHECSGGMRQRALVAMAMANDPALLVADEPTSSLDVTVQAQVLDVLQRVRERTGSALLLVTHDLGVVARMADRVLVLDGGRAAELGDADQVLVAPASSVTRRLLAADPYHAAPGVRASLGPTTRGPVLEVEGLVKRFGAVEAVAGMSFDVARGETLAIVGESGSGKTTALRCVARLESPTAGRIRFGGHDIGSLRGRSLRAWRRRLQIVFQDPNATLNPRLTVGAVLVDPLRVHRLHRGKERERAAELLGLVELDAVVLDRYPHELSGGQRQRVGIARALAVDPEVVVLDEPVSALDVSVRAEILHLLTRLQDRLDLAYVFVSHDLGVVRQVAHRVAVAHLGTFVEEGTVADVFDRPAHPYTRALLSAVPVPDPRVERVRERIVLVGDQPDAADPPSGCRFHPRCWWRLRLEADGVDTTPCRADAPGLVDRGSGHPVACHFAAAVLPG